MVTSEIRFDDGAAYDRMMGVWSRLVGEEFLDWLAPLTGLAWADIGCGSGAFSAPLAERCAPREIQGIDPSEEQLAYARAQPTARLATYRQGDAMALPYVDNGLDAAVMALVLFFVPDPAKGVAEMVRVVKPGGLVSAYVWDALNDGSPTDPIAAELKAMGHRPPLPPSVTISRMDALIAAWATAGLEAIESRVIEVRRSFADFEEFWAITSVGSRLAVTIKALTPADRETLIARVRARLPADANGRITYASKANAIKGRRSSKA